jgi:hypothetical protein
MSAAGRCAILLAAVLSAATPVFGQGLQTGPLPRTAGTPYAARGIPDRIVLTPGGDPTIEMAVAFRTDADQTEAVAEIAPALAGPTLEMVATCVAGTSLAMDGSNGDAFYHQVRFNGLRPDTEYAYRVKGAAGWSEWLQFRTAARGPVPFRFLYLGDVQNGILAYGSRTIRQAFAQGGIRLVLQAGDLVDQGATLDHDDEWGEWNQAGGYNYAMVPQVPAAGNHEYLIKDGVPGPYWLRQFALPSNGAPGLEATTYFTDFQGVRFIVLDGTSGINNKTAEAQARWLDHVLASSKARWKVVLYHQPIFPCRKHGDAEPLKLAWKPVFEKRGVDLVLHGHDHCYSRLTSAPASTAPMTARAKGLVKGPVYIVSVAGTKMFALADHEGIAPDHVAEATQLYQLVDVEAARLRFRTYGVDGALYDGFDLQHDARGRKTLKPVPLPMQKPRRCRNGAGPDGGPCVAIGG